MTQENERSKLEESRDEESSEGYVMPEMQNMKDSFDTFSLRADTFITKIKTL